MKEKKNKKKSNWDTMLTGANGRISSKRVLGCFILVVLLIVITTCVFVKPELSWLGDAFIKMMIGAFALLGIGIFEKRFKNPLPKEDESNNDSENIDENECKKTEEDEDGERGAI